MPGLGSVPLEFPLRVNGQDGYVLLISCLGDEDTGGGLFEYDGYALTRVDRLSSTGLAVANGQLARLLWSSEGTGGVGELLLSDAHGVVRYLRLDDIREPHDIHVDGHSLIIVSTLTNSILRVSGAGLVEGAWQFEGDGDAWHLNSLGMKDGELYASAFGRFTAHREWTRHKADGSGIVFHLSTRDVVIGGLNQPHCPRFFDGRWAVCNSADQEVLQVGPAAGEVLRRVKLNGFTRGFAVTDDYLFVGESAKRGDGSEGGRASIAVLCRRSWEFLYRLALPCREVYDVVLAPRSVAEGAGRGFRTSAHRVAEQDQYHLFRRAGVEPVRLWATGDPLPAEACRVVVTADLPGEMVVGSEVTVGCVVENRGGALLCSLPPHPIHLSYKWISPETGHQLPDTEGLRAALPRTLPPGQPTACQLPVRAPAVLGDFVLRVTLVQEQVAWFDQFGSENCREAIVRVRPAPAAGSRSIGDAGTQAHPAGPYRRADADDHSVLDDLTPAARVEAAQ